MYQIKLATLVLSLEQAYKERADEVADLLPPSHWVQSVTNRILSEKDLDSPVRVSLLGLLARLLKVLPSTLHPHLPPHLVGNLAKEGNSDVREALFAVLHSLIGNSSWMAAVANEHQLEVLNYLLKHGDLESCLELLGNANPLGNTGENGELSAPFIQYIGLLGIRYSEARATCIKLLQRAVLWSEGETAQEALHYLLDLLYLEEFNEEGCQILLNLFCLFSRAKRYENQATILAYGILRQVQANGDNILSVKLMETMRIKSPNPAIEQLVQLFDAAQLM